MYEWFYVYYFNDKDTIIVISFKQVFFLSSAEGSLVDIRAYIALQLGGTLSQETGTSPPSYSSTTVYISYEVNVLHTTS